MVDSRLVDVIILTYNEERHIVRAIRSVSSFARTVFVVDSHSTDRTVELARDSGAIVSEHDFVNQAKQFQWALDTLATDAPWIMRLDADEIVEPGLAAEIRERLPALAPDIVGVNLKRKHIFLGRWVRHGGRYPVILLRIWRRGCGRVEDRWMDEHIIVEGGRTLTFNGDFCDHNLSDLTAFTEKHNRYATREAIDVLNHRYQLFPRGPGLQMDNASQQATVKRYIKERIYNRLPFPIAAFAYFSWRYIVKFGFLDGPTGLAYHFLQGYWYRFLVGAKVMELDRAIGPLTSAQERLRELQRQTGFPLLEQRDSAEQAP
jgi:glycosyltransferase involved in cell wall biosynthesis